MSTSAPTKRPAAGMPREYHFPRFQRHTLSNGLRLVVATVSKLPLVTVNAVMEAGSAVENAGQEGVASLTVRLLLEGAAGLDGAALAEQFEEIGAQVEAHANWDVATVSLTSLSSHSAEALALVRDLVRTPTFPEREVDRLREERLAEILQLRAEPRGLADEQFSSAIYASSARYAHPEAGNERSVSGLTREDVRSFHAQRYAPASTTLVFAGDISLAAATSLAESLFGDWTSTTTSAPQGNVDVRNPGRLVRVVGKADAPQSELRVGHAGLSRAAADYFDVTVMNAVLGGLFSSRINMNLREAHGYTYGASSAFDWRRGAGPFVIYTAVKSDATGPAVKEILGEIDRIRSEEISADELTLATSYLDGVFPIRFETTSAIADALTNLVVYRLPEDYYDAYRGHVRAVTTASVLRAAHDHLHPDQLRILVVGDPVAVVKPLAEVTGLEPEVVNVEPIT